MEVQLRVEEEFMVVVWAVLSQFMIRTTKKQEYYEALYDSMVAG
jgi:hypothetical protein